MPKEPKTRIQMTRPCKNHPMWKVGTWIDVTDAELATVTAGTYRVTREKPKPEEDTPAPAPGGADKGKK